MEKQMRREESKDNSWWFSINNWVMILHYKVGNREKTDFERKINLNLLNLSCLWISKWKF